jgi:hypothetical protein
MHITIIAAAMLPVLSSAAPAQQAISCPDFRHNEDGSWTPLKNITIAGPNRQAEFRPGMSLRAGVVVNGVDLGGLFDVMCAIQGQGRGP